MKLSIGLIAVAVLTAAQLTSAAVLRRQPEDAKIAKRVSLGYGRNGKALPDLANATLAELQSGLDAGTFTSVDLVKAYIARINETNYLLNAILEVNPEALSLAAKADAARKAGNSTGVLAGIPVIIKDNIATERTSNSSMNTTAGSFALLGSFPAGDSTIAAFLKRAGAIILGKSNLSQWANYRSTNSTNGWTARGNQTSGAYFAQQDPSGSSSGSGVASSIGLAWAALGTETSGSIVSPSQRNNLCGIKPSVGLTSRYRVIPISQNQDTIGPMARTCADAAALLFAIAGYDSNDNYTSAIPFPNASIPDYRKACTASGLQGAKIGVPAGFITSSATNGPELAAFNATFELIRQLGATLNTNANFPNASAYAATGSYAVNPVTGVDFVANVKTYFQGLLSNPSGVSDIQSLINYTHADPREAWPDRNTATWEQAAASNLTQTSPAYTQALAFNKFAGSNATILGALEKYGLDALILPTSQAAGVAAIAGYPIVTVPLGFYPSNTTVVRNSRGTLTTLGPHFPFGISFLGRRFSEEKLIAYACAFEAATNRRVQVDPIVLPSTQLIDVISV